jgi:hypothetical protein
MQEGEIRWILSLPTEWKLKLLRDMLQEDRFRMAVNFSQILMDWPPEEGGISKDQIHKIFQELG